MTTERRIYDRVRAGEFTFPTYQKLEPPEDYGAMKEIVSGCANALHLAVPVVVDELVPGAMEPTGLDPMSKALFEDRLCMRPPYDVTWIEARSTGLDRAILNRFDAIGVELSVRDSTGEEAMAHFRAPASDGWDVAGTVWGTFARTARLLRSDDRRPFNHAHLPMPLGSLMLHLDGEGRLETVPGEDGGYAALVQGRWFGCWQGFPAVPHGSDAFAPDAVLSRLAEEELVRIVLPHLWACSLLHCRNVSLDDGAQDGIPRQLRRLEERQGLEPRARYKILHVKVPGEKRPRPLASLAEPGQHGMIRYHSVRAHQITFTPEAPAFGKPWGVGTFLVGPGWRGNPKRGIVKKEYDLHPAEGPEHPGSAPA